MIAACLLIAYDPGGLILPRLEAVRDNPCVVISGFCASACTLHLAAPQVCIGRGATLGFHGPSGAGRWRDYYVTVIADHYPPKLAEWYLSGPADLQSYELAILNADQAAALGVQVCG